MIKTSIRKQFQKIRKHIPQEKKNVYSKNITEQIQKIIHAKQIENQKKTLHICLFAGTKNEPNLLHLLKIFSKEITQKTIKFYFPKCEIVQKNRHTENNMNFYEVSNISDLQLDKNQKLHILEPNINSTTQRVNIQKTSVDLFIIPAVSVDKDKNRIGMGGGFYDKYFEKYFLHHSRKNTQIICTIFECQQSEKKFITDIFDIPVDTVVTENKIC